MCMENMFVLDLLIRIDVSIDIYRISFRDISNEISHIFQSNLNKIGGIAKYNKYNL